MSIQESIPDFETRVYDVVARVPRGRVITYGTVARLAGSPGAARAVGSFMRKNYRSDVPCHRVIRADGHIGGYNRGGRETKITLLKAEGIDVENPLADAISCV